MLRKIDLSLNSLPDDFFSILPCTNSARKSSPYFLVLSTLILDDNKLTNISSIIKHCGNSLKLLSVKRNRIASIEIEDFVRFKAPVALYLEGNPVLRNEAEVIKINLGNVLLK